MKKKMNKINYQLELDKIIKKLQKDNKTPTLLMHSCCAPCSSYCLSYLAEYFKITIFYYNPNISPLEEYQKRVNEQKRLISELPVKNKICFEEGKYDPQTFFDMAKGFVISKINVQIPHQNPPYKNAFAVPGLESLLCSIAFFLPKIPQNTSAYNTLPDKYPINAYITAYGIFFPPDYALIFVFSLWHFPPFSSILCQTHGFRKAGSVHLDIPCFCWCLIFI